MRRDNSRGKAIFDGPHVAPPADFIWQSVGELQDQVDALQDQVDTLRAAIKKTPDPDTRAALEKELAALEMELAQVKRALELEIRRAECISKFAEIEPKLGADPARAQLDQLVHECAALRYWPRNLPSDANLTLKAIERDVGRLRGHLEQIGTAASGPLFRAFQTHGLDYGDTIAFLERLATALEAAKLQPRDGKPADHAPYLLAIGLRRILGQSGCDVTTSAHGLWRKCLRAALPVVGSRAQPASVLRGLAEYERKAAAP